MDFEWDEEKRRANIAKHGLDFADVDLLDWDGATFREDTRKDYGERRYLAFAMWNSRFYVVTYVHRSEKIRIINFRRANQKEIRRYGET